MAVRYITSQRGGRKLVFEDFIYVKKNSSATSTYWACSKRDSLGCMVTAISSAPNPDLPPRINGEHIHDTTAAEVEAAEAIQVIRERAGQNQDPPARLRLDVMADMGNEAQEVLPNADALRRRVQRVRNRQYPQNVPLNELVIADDWAVTAGQNPERFLLHDNNDHNRRVIVFASPPCLEKLSRAEAWFTDGNFAMSPLHFQQLYVIRVQIGNDTVTAAYALLQRKTRETYRILFDAIVNGCRNAHLPVPQPQRAHCDFEVAVHQAIRLVLPNTEIAACFYHLTQSTWRKIQELGLVNRYREAEQVRIFVGKLDGLAFLPIPDVAPGLVYLRGITPQGFEDLVDYFDATYITGVRQAVRMPNGVMRINVANAPAFPPRVWNVREATLHQNPRTNNHCEGWNSRLKHIVGHDHPSVWRLLTIMKKEDNSDRAKIRLHDQGDPLNRRVRAVTITLNRRLLTLCERHRDGLYQREEFLDLIGAVVRAF